MGRRRVGFVNRFALTAGVVLGVVLAAQQPVFRVDVRLVRLLVTVKDAGGRAVGGLERDDFTVYDNDTRQELAVFERHTEQPLSVALLVDTSASTGIQLGYETESASRFLRALLKEGNPKDSASLYSFTHDVHLRSSFTRNLGRLDRELKELRAEAGTSLYDAIWFASRAISDRNGRHVLVLVSDGGDTTSAKTFRDALDAAQMADAVLYSVVVIPVPNPPGRNIGGEHALITLSQSTGGRVFTPELGPALDEAFREILRDLRTQYLLAYYPKNVPPTTDRFHRLRVELNRLDLRVSSRTGYYGDYSGPNR